MKAEIVIPKGWRKLPTGALLKRGDRHFSFEGGAEWFVTDKFGPPRVEKDIFIYIRRKPTIHYANPNNAR